MGEGPMAVLVNYKTITNITHLNNGKLSAIHSESMY